MKSALLAAARITYTDPASGGPSGIHLAKVWNDLGIATAICPTASAGPKSR